MKADIVVVGGSAAGVTCALTARRHYPDKRVLLIRKEEKVLVPCGIPYVFGTVGTTDKNLIPDQLLIDQGIGLRIGEVVELEPHKAQLRLSDGQTIQYDRLVVATGSLPKMPCLPGENLPNVFPVLKDVHHLNKIQQVLGGVRNVVVLGGGFISTEMAQECRKLPGKSVTVLVSGPQCMALSLDPEFCQVAQCMLEACGIRILTGKSVAGMNGNGTVCSVDLKCGTTLPAEVVIVGKGSRAHSDLAQQAGLPIGPTGAVQVDAAMATADERILACGDCCEKWSFFDGRPVNLMAASIATYEARIAGANLFEKRRRNPGAVGARSTIIGTTAVGTAGLTETGAMAWGIPCVTGSAEAANRHPAGMPGMVKTRLKLVFHARSGVLLGGQAVGDASTGEVTNLLSACIQKRMTAEELAMFQAGTHPALTASPIAYPLVNAAEEASRKIR